VTLTSSQIWEGITGVSSLASAIVLGAATVIAWLQLDSWKHQRVAIKKAEIAEELIAACLDVDDALAHIRTPFDSIPIEKAKDKIYPYQQRLDRIQSYGERFRALRSAQIRARAVIGDKKVDESVDVLFQARARVLTAIEMLAEYAREDYASQDQSDRDRKKRLRSDLYGASKEYDELGKKVREAVELIEMQMIGLVRLEEAEK
jgi:membrane-associated HD superfamily phosphohydrolase